MKIAYLIIGAIALVVLAGAGGFFGGMTFAQSQAQNTVSDFARQRAINGGGQANGQGATAGATANNPCGFGGPITFQQTAPNGATGATGAQSQTQGQTQGQAQGQTQGAGQGNGQRRQGNGQFGGFGGFAALGNCVARGEIKSVNGDTVEISTADSVVTVKVNDTTVISKTDRGTISDLKAGDRVTVFSQESGDSPTASTIQLQPAPPTNQ